MHALSSVDLVVDDSDYGDFGNDVEELEILEELISQVEVGVDDEPRLRLPKVAGVDSHSQTNILDDSKQPQETPSSPRPKPPDPPAVPEDRSPLERFRKPPRKAFSVTDLVSPSWCELQYFYSLVEPGRKKKTAAMKRGTAVHQALEDEIHTSVPVEVTTKADRWGLRIWNIIQGLRTLRETGRTRELEIWGSINGEVVTGIIDELSYDCPVPPNAVPAADKETSATNQTSLTEYLGWKPEPSSSEVSTQQIYITDVKTRVTATLPTGSSVRPTILQLHLYHHLLENLVRGQFPLSQLAERYSLDVNETFSDSFIAQLAAVSQDLSDLAGSRSSQADLPAPSSQQLASTQDSLDILLSHNNLLTLWGYMMAEFQLTFLLTPDQQSVAATQHLAALRSPVPETKSQEPVPQLQILPGDHLDLAVSTASTTRLAKILTAEYLSSSSKPASRSSSPSSSPAANSNKKHSLGKRTFGYNPVYLQAYLEDSMAWWHGKRPARGVDLEDTWKCRSCDFRSDCQWIQDRDGQSLADALEKKRLRNALNKNKGGTVIADAAVSAASDLQGPRIKRSQV